MFRLFQLSKISYKSSNMQIPSSTVFPNWVRPKNTTTNKNIAAHRLTQDPTATWREIERQQKVIKVNLEPANNQILPDKVRFVCMSDTHSKEKNIQFNIPEGDVFIHAGDFTNIGMQCEVVQFNDWLGTLPHKHKIVIAGNHELSFDSTCRISKIDVDCQKVKNCLTNCIYLEDSGVDLYEIKIYGSPWQPVSKEWAFNMNRGEDILSKWNLIPADTDILITHGPPLGHGDLNKLGLRAGCAELLTTLQKRVQPKLHIFGHIHEGYGVTTDGTTIFVNAACCDVNYCPVNPPIVFDLPLS